MAIEFSRDTYEELQDIIKRYPSKMAATLPALHLVQRDFGYISDDSIKYVAKLLDLSNTEVLNTVSFYTMYYRKEMGKHVIQVCHTLACALCDAKNIVEHISNKLGIRYYPTLIIIDKSGKMRVRHIGYSKSLEDFEWLLTNYIEELLGQNEKSYFTGMDIYFNVPDLLLSNIIMERLNKLSPGFPRKPDLTIA